VTLKRTLLSHAGGGEKTLYWKARSAYHIVPRWRGWPEGPGVDLLSSASHPPPRPLPRGTKKGRLPYFLDTDLRRYDETVPHWQGLKNTLIKSAKRTLLSPAGGCVAIIYATGYLSAFWQQNIGKIF